MKDIFGRTIDYLRISVTDRCNLRCVYCMPPEGIAWQSHAAILRYEEITRMVRVAADLGMSKVRLTGGEPLVRPHLERLVEMIAAVPGIADISMTTNAVLLEHHAPGLARAGLRRVNISLDTLQPHRFRAITRYGNIEDVWRGIHAAEQAGLTPIKINVVVVQGVNDDELVDFAQLTLERDWHVRFIELMPVANEGDWGPGLPAPQRRYVPVATMQTILATALMPAGLKWEDCQDAAPVGHGPAIVFRLPGAKGTLGFISPVSRHFCPTCNRLRLTADGKLRPCLLSEGEVDVRTALRNGASDEHLKTLILRAINYKPERHQLDQCIVPLDRVMAQIGG